MVARHLLVLWLLLLPAAARSAPCPCDCNDDGSVAINELITGVNVALGEVPVAQCPSFPDCETGPCVLITSLVQCVNAALSGCAAEPTPTATVEPGSATLPALLDDVAPAICAGVLTTPGGHLTVSAADDMGLISCDSFIGHYGSVRLTRYASSAAATAVFGEVLAGEEVDEVGGGTLRNRVTTEVPSGHTTQDWRWLRGCWIATGHAFDDTSYRFAPQPHASVSTIAASALFADLLARCDS